MTFQVAIDILQSVAIILLAWSSMRHAKVIGRLWGDVVTLLRGVAPPDPRDG